MEETMKFEEALDQLKKLSEIIQSPSTSLEQSIASYEEGMKYYERCLSILDNAEQKITVFEER